MSLLKPARPDAARKIDLTLTGDHPARLDRIREAAKAQNQTVDLSAALRPHVEKLLADAEHALGLQPTERRRPGRPPNTTSRAPLPASNPDTTAAPNGAAAAA
jgi:hypothetical protein